MGGSEAAMLLRSCGYSPAGRRRCRSGAAPSSRPPWGRSSRRSPRPPGGAAAAGATRSGRGRPTRGRCRSPRRRGPPTPPCGRTAADRDRIRDPPCPSRYTTTPPSAGIPSQLSLYLQTLSHGLQHVGDDGVVPQVREPDPGPLHVHGAGQEEPRSWEAQGRALRRRVAGEQTSSRAGGGPPPSYRW